MASASASPSPAPEAAGSSALPAPVNRHKPTAVEVQRMQLSRLLKDPSKPAHIPAPPKEKTIRPAREMMKNVQGSSAGAGSGEFHVYKAARRREYERLKMMEDTTEKVCVSLYPVFFFFFSFIYPLFPYHTRCWALGLKTGC